MKEGDQHETNLKVLLQAHLSSQEDEKATDEALRVFSRGGHIVSLNVSLISSSYAFSMDQLQFGGIKIFTNTKTKSIKNLKVSPVFHIKKKNAIRRLKKVFIDKRALDVWKKF